MLIGLISDTHGMLRAAVHAAFKGVDRILHAGDVGGDLILDELELIAPVEAVFGNTDPASDPRLQEAIDIHIAGLSIHVSHGHELGSPKPEALLKRYDADIIIYGHTHKQLIARSGNRVVINPGAAGARRFNLEASVARLLIANGNVDVEIRTLA